MDTEVTEMVTAWGTEVIVTAGRVSVLVEIDIVVTSCVITGRV